MKKLTVVIIAKDKIVYDQEADAVSVPTQTGIIEILANHMQLVSALSEGEIIVKNSNESKKFKILGGVIEVRKHSNVIILVDLKRE